jgi:hypothetical protein
MSSPPVFSGVHVTRSSVLYVWFVDRCLSFVLFLLAIVLSVLLRSTDSDCPFGIFKLVFHKKRSWKVECSCSLETCWMLLEFELDHSKPPSLSQVCINHLYMWCTLGHPPTLCKCRILIHRTKTVSSFNLFVKCIHVVGLHRCEIMFCYNINCA